jgi:hypothetical protein
MEENLVRLVAFVGAFDRQIVNERERPPTKIRGKTEHKMNNVGNGRSGHAEELLYQ